MSLNITSTMLIVSFNKDITIGRSGSIKMTLEYQAYINRGVDGRIEVELDCVDYSNISFLDEKIEYGSESFKKFKENMLGLGIDVKALIDEERKHIENQDTKNELINMFHNKI